MVLKVQEERHNLAKDNLENLFAYAKLEMALLFGRAIFNRRNNANFAKYREKYN